MHGTEAPAPWVRRWSHLVPAGQAVLDVACGAGRHLAWFAQRGHPVTGVDRDAGALAKAGERLPPGQGPAACRLVEADIENGPWPFAGQQFGAVVVTNYLWRARLRDILGSVADEGVLIYETFAAGNETVGRPSRPDFLLEPGELLAAAAAAGLRVVAYEDGFQADPPRFVQRIVAIRSAGRGGPPLAFEAA